MKRIDSPKKQPVPFGINGQRENLLPSTPAGDNTASYSDGFPAVTMILKAAGGLPPKGQDMNQILFELSSLARWASTGAVNAFDADFATSIGGYPKGAILLGDDGATLFISTSDSNLNNPNNGGAGWFNLSAGYLRTLNNLSDLPDKPAARTNLSLDRIGQDSDETRMAGPDKKTYIYVNNLDWGAYNTGSNPGKVALPVSSGGTGAGNADAARANLKLDRIGQPSSETQVFAPNKRFYTYVNNTEWGAYDLDKGTTVPLSMASGGTGAQNAADARDNLGLGPVATETTVPVSKGGTGASNLTSARSNLQVNRLVQGTADTYISSPSDNDRLFVNDNGGWGVVNNIGTPIALAVNMGGTGATNAAAARSNLALGAVATENTVPVSKGGTGATDATGARNNLQLGSAATATLGTGTNQVPTMAAFTSGPGWFRFPDGTIIQFGTNIAGSAGYPTAVTFPIPFTADFRVTCSYDTPTSEVSPAPAFATSKFNNQGFYLASSRVGNVANAGANWIAVGK